MSFLRYERFVLCSAVLYRKHNVFRHSVLALQLIVMAKLISFWKQDYNQQIALIKNRTLLHVSAIV